MAGKQFRKARWMWASATGSDDEAIRAEQAVGRDMAAAVREDTRGPVDPRVQALLDEVSAPLAGRVRNRTLCDAVLIALPNDRLYLRPHETYQYFHLLSARTLSPRRRQPPRRALQ